MHRASSTKFARARGGPFVAPGRTGPPGEVRLVRAGPIRGAIILARVPGASTGVAGTKGAFTRERRFVNGGCLGTKYRGSC